MLIYGQVGNCPHCGNEFLPQKSSMYLSSGVLGAIIGILAVAVLKLDHLSAMGLSLLLVFVIQQLCNLFYSLDTLDG